MRQPSLADVTERLFTEFEGRLPLRTIVTTVRRTKREIDIARSPATLDLVERLARQRLTRLTDPQGPASA